MVKCILERKTYFSNQLTVGKFYDFEIKDMEYSLITNYEKYFEHTSIMAGSRDNARLAKEEYELRKNYVKKVKLPTLIVTGDDDNKHYFCNAKHSDIIEEHNVIIDKNDVINERNGHQSRIFTTSIYMTETYFETMDVLRNRILENLGI
jgi:hypothetical protein